MEKVQKLVEPRNEKRSGPLRESSGEVQFSWEVVSVQTSASMQ